RADPELTDQAERLLRRGGGEDAAALRPEQEAGEDAEGLFGVHDEDGGGAEGAREVHHTSRKGKGWGAGRGRTASAYPGGGRRKGKVRGGARSATRDRFDSPE